MKEVKLLEYPVYVDKCDVYWRGRSLVSSNPDEQFRYMKMFNRDIMHFNTLNKHVIEKVDLIRPGEPAYNKTVESWRIWEAWQNWEPLLCGEWAITDKGFKYIYEFSWDDKWTIYSLLTLRPRLTLNTDHPLMAGWYLPIYETKTN